MALHGQDAGDPRRTTMASRQRETPSSGTGTPSSSANRRAPRARPARRVDAMTSTNRCGASGDDHGVTSRCRAALTSASRGRDVSGRTSARSASVSSPPWARPATASRRRMVVPPREPTAQLPDPRDQRLAISRAESTRAFHPPLGEALERELAVVSVEQGERAERRRNCSVRGIAAPLGPARIRADGAPRSPAGGTDRRTRERRTPARPEASAPVQAGRAGTRSGGRQENPR